MVEFFEVVKYLVYLIVAYIVLSVANNLTIKAENWVVIIAVIIVAAFLIARRVDKARNAKACLPRATPSIGH